MSSATHHKPIMRPKSVLDVFTAAVLCLRPHFKAGCISCSAARHYRTSSVRPPLCHSSPVLSPLSERPHKEGTYPGTAALVAHGYLDPSTPSSSSLKRRLAK